MDAANCRAEARMRGGEGDLCGFTSLVTIPLGAVAGSLVGLAIGANTKVERWTTVMAR